MRWNGRCLGNKGLLGPAETMGPREEYEQTSFHHLVHISGIYGDGSLPGIGPLSAFF